MRIRGLVVVLVELYLAAGQVHPSPPISVIPLPTTSLFSTAANTSSLGGSTTTYATPTLPLSSSFFSSGTTITSGNVTSSLSSTSSLTGTSSSSLSIGSSGSVVTSSATINSGASAAASPSTSQPSSAKSRSEVNVPISIILTVLAAYVC